MMTTTLVAVPTRMVGELRSAGHSQGLCMRTVDADLVDQIQIFRSKDVHEHAYQHDTCTSSRVREAHGDGGLCGWTYTKTSRWSAIRSEPNHRATERWHLAPFRIGRQIQWEAGSRTRLTHQLAAGEIYTRSHRPVAHEGQPSRYPRSDWGILLARKHGRPFNAGQSKPGEAIHSPHQAGEIPIVDASRGREHGTYLGQRCRDAQRYQGNQDPSPDDGHRLTVSQGYVHCSAQPLRRRRSVDLLKVHTTRTDGGQLDYARRAQLQSRPN